jgi:hypothetical protein
MTPEDKAAIQRVRRRKRQDVRQALRLGAREGFSGISDIEKKAYGATQPSSPTLPINLPDEFELASILLAPVKSANKYDSLLRRLRTDPAARAGFQHAESLISALRTRDGQLSIDVVEGIRDALFGRPANQWRSVAYRTAHDTFLTARIEVPVEFGKDSGLAKDRYRGGFVASAASRYAAVTGNPMVTRELLNLIDGRPLISVPFRGKRSSVHGSLLEGMKESAGMANETTAQANKTLDAAATSLNKWQGAIAEAEAHVTSADMLNARIGASA